MFFLFPVRLISFRTSTWLVWMFQVAVVMTLAVMRFLHFVGGVIVVFALCHLP